MITETWELQDLNAEFVRVRYRLDVNLLELAKVSQLSNLNCELLVHVSLSFAILF